MVSVVLVTYNRCNLLQLSIRDILNQTFKDFELIVCDDNSEDDTANVVSSFIDSRIVYVRSDVNKGMPQNLIDGLLIAKYEFIGILHDGDRFQDDLLEKWYTAMITHENVGVVFNPLITFDLMGNQVLGPQLFKEGCLSGRSLIKDYYFSNYLFPSLIWGEAMVRKKFIIEFNYLDKNFGFYADVDLWMTILRKYDAYYCPNYLIHCPDKSIVPNLFDSRLIRSSFVLMDIHYKQRRVFFRGSSYFLFHMGYFYLQCIQNFVHINLIIQKNFGMREILFAGYHTFRNKLYFFPLWVSLLPFKLLFNISTVIQYPYSINNEKNK